jgi:carbamoyltransferase
VRILGVSAFYHDSAAALIEDGRIVAAAQEERFSRVKHDSRFPHGAVRYCLAEAGIPADGVDYVAFYEKPFVKFERLLETYLAFAPRGFRSFRLAAPVWLREKLFQRSVLVREMKEYSRAVDWDSRLLFGDHHMSHAAAAFYPSPFEEAAILTVDGVGEWTTTSIGLGRGASIEVLEEIRFPHSLGLLYSAFTYYTGFKVNSGEYKLMGLAPYGEPRYRKKILDELIDLRPDGSFRLNLSYFDYCTGLRMTNRRFADLFGGPPRAPAGEITQFHMDVAASIQAVTEEAVLALTRRAAERTGMRRLAMAGGVALNCVANGRALRDGRFDEIWIQPAAGDAGGALGVALCAYHQHLGKPRIAAGAGGDAMQGALLGPAWSQAEIETELRAAGAVLHSVDDGRLLRETVDALERGEAVGWFQGRMEFGPRALGARSILADPRSPEMQTTLNLKIKFRESFRPFAPSVPKERAAEYFDLQAESPYMLLVAGVRPELRLPADPGLFGLERLRQQRSTIPAVTHLDYSARVQTVDREVNPLYHDLLEAFRARTGCAVLVNTSFNVRGEPIVCTPADAYRCFMATGLGLLACGNCIVRKEEQPAAHGAAEYASQFELD